MNISKIRNSFATHIMCRYSDKFDQKVKSLYLCIYELRHNKTLVRAKKQRIKLIEIKLKREVEQEILSFESDSDTWKILNSDNDYYSAIVLKIQKQKAVKKAA